MPIVKGLRRFRFNNVSFRQVVTEISNLVPGSNVQTSKWSSAVPSTPKRKRISSADRRVLLESFVNKYRAANSGKFPTPTSAVREVGGGYYSIKKMLQEMEYHFKMSSEEKEKVAVKEAKEQKKVEDTVNKKVAVKSSRSQQVSNTQITVDQNLHEDAWLESVGNSDKNSKGKEKLQPSTSSEEIGNNNITRDDTANIATESHDRKAQSDDKLENHVKDKDKVGFEGIDTKAEQKHGEISNVMRDMPESQKDVVLREKESPTSIWGSLKSLASDFINIWK